MDRTFGKPAIANEDSTSDTLTLANEDSTSDTLTLANEDSTSDTLTLANEDSTSDNLTLASLDRDNQGPWEFEYSYEEEDGLHQHYDKCKKNPGHKNFIPVDEFSIEDLPEDYHDKEIVDYIRAVSDLTVRVSVKFVSDRRPAAVSSCHKPSAGSSAGGRRRMTVGTGWVDSIIDQIGPCKCKVCRNSSTPEMNFATIIINTAAHVVFDDLEGEHTTCHLFFDRGVNPDTCRGAVPLTGMSGVFSYVIDDMCYLEHYTHDLHLADRLRQTIENMYKIKLNICNKIPYMSQLKQSPNIQKKHPLLFVVSHPHGCSKQVSLGRWTSAYVFNNITMSLLYNTATCPGSSGALVCVLPEYRSIRYKWKFTSDVLFMSMPRAHCGASDGKLEVNFCRIHEVAPTPPLVSVEMLHLNKGGFEDNCCCVEEEDQNQHYAACKKNPGHENFFPVEKFSMDNLPSFYRSDDVMEFIKLVSDLTVRVSVKYVSEERPETVPGTDIPYPWFSSRGSSMVRVGTGWIEDAVVYLREIVENCSCKECRNSPNPKTELAYITIKTAAHLVYDELEAQHTTCHLFFDSGETPDVCTNVVTLTDVYEFSKESEFDACTIKYFTHNHGIVGRIKRMGRQYIDGLQSLSMKYSVKSTKYDKQNVGDQTKQEPLLHFVVSHPHGCSKQLSICGCANPGNADIGESQNSHSFIVCPGFSGAPVLDLSRKLFYPFIG